jgi:hypothetical protein
MIYSLFLVILHFVCFAIDLVSFFILVRFLRQWRSTQLLIALDHLGSPILAEVMRSVEQASKSLGIGIPTSTNEKLLVVLILLTMIRLFAFLFGVVIL